MKFELFLTKRVSFMCTGRGTGRSLVSPTVGQALGYRHEDIVLCLSVDRVIPPFDSSDTFDSVLCIVHADGRAGWTFKSNLKLHRKRR